jgi:hypothetical protein
MNSKQTKLPRNYIQIQMKTNKNTRNFFFPRFFCLWIEIANISIGSFKKVFLLIWNRKIEKTAVCWWSGESIFYLWTLKKNGPVCHLHSSACGWIIAIPLIHTRNLTTIQYSLSLFSKLINVRPEIMSLSFEYWWNEA